jgi:hypothetical protein
MLKVRRACNDILKSMNGQPRSLYLAKLTFIIEEEIKTFHDKIKPQGIHNH